MSEGVLIAVPGSVDTLLRLMQQKAVEGASNSYVQQLASIATPSGDIPAMYDWLKAHYGYAPDPSGTFNLDGREVYYEELLIAPSRIAEDYVTRGLTYSMDCDDMATLSAAMLRILCYAVRIAVVAFSQSGDLEHAYAEYYSDEAERWVAFDLASTKPLGWEYPYTRAMYLTL